MITKYEEIENGVIQRTDIDDEITTSYLPVKIGDTRTDTDEDGNETIIDCWQEAIDAGAVMLSDEAKAATLAEQSRQSAKSTLAKSLDEMTYTFEDGRTLQTRPKDAQNFQAAIGLGQDIEFICADNSISLFTVVELTEAMSAGIIAAAVAWSTYIDAIR